MVNRIQKFKQSKLSHADYFLKNAENQKKKKQKL